MNQMQAFIEKAKNDSGLMAKLDELGASGADHEKITALAADYGFSITEEDCQNAMTAGMQKAGELAEEDLDAVAGGSILITENRHYPELCSTYTETQYNCVGFLSIVNCYYYHVESFKNDIGGTSRVVKSCRMGYFENIYFE